MNKNPYDYVPQPKGVNKERYLRMAQLDAGENKIRILLAPVSYWQYWEPVVDENGSPLYMDDGRPKQKPMRFPMHLRPDNEEAKYIIAYYIWHYKRLKTYILQIDQVSVLNGLKKLELDKDFGPLAGYDLKITKTGELLKTRYAILPMAPKPIGADIEEALANEPINLQALIECKDPWSDLDIEEPVIQNTKTEKPVASLSMSPLEELKESLEIERVPTDRLEEWIKLRCQTTNKGPDVVIKACLEKGVLPKFIKSFVKWLGGPQEAMAV